MTEDGGLVGCLVDRLATRVSKNNAGGRSAHRLTFNANTSCRIARAPTAKRCLTTTSFM